MPCTPTARPCSAGQYIGYDAGGTLPPGPSLVYNGTGQPEIVAPRQTFDQIMSGASGGARGDVVGIQFNGPTTVTDTDAMAAKGFRHAAQAEARFRR
jgi:hypothetical protein